MLIKTLSDISYSLLLTSMIKHPRDILYLACRPQNSNMLKMVVRSEDLEVIFIQLNNSSITDKSPLANLIYKKKERKT